MCFQTVLDFHTISCCVAYLCTDLNITVIEKEAPVVMAYVHQWNVLITQQGHLWISGCTGHTVGFDLPPLSLTLSTPSTVFDWNLMPCTWPHIPTKVHGYIADYCCLEAILVYHAPLSLSSGWWCSWCSIGHAVCSIRVASLNRNLQTPAIHCCQMGKDHSTRLPWEHGHGGRCVRQMFLLQPKALAHLARFNDIVNIWFHAWPVNVLAYTKLTLCYSLAAHVDGCK